MKDSKIRGGLAALLGAAVLVATLTGCAGASRVSSPDTSEETGKAMETPAPSPSFAEEPEAAPPADTGIGAFGDAFTYTDGVAISVSAPAAFTPTGNAAGVDQAAAVVLTIVLTNNSDKVLDPSVYATVSSGGVAASRIFDFENPFGDVSTYPSAPILPGGTFTWNEAYSVADPASIIYAVSPNFTYDQVIFTNSQ